ncbi:MAG: glycine zipper 2TM domain-containing protein [Pseudomonadota bacterium]
MKSVALASTLALGVGTLAGPAWAAVETDRGTVISVTPIVQQVVVPRRVCNDEPVAVQRQPSGAGALIGAIAGGAMGNAIGAGSGRAAATALGVLGGAVVGNSIEGGGQNQVQSMRRCTTENAYEDRNSGFNVVYEYGGREYTTQMRQDPGRYVQVQVQASPEGGVVAPREYAPQQRSRSAPPRSAPVYVERPVYQGYEAYPEPVYQTYPAPAPVYYEPGYPQFGTGLVLGALIGYGAHYGYSRHWHGGRGYRGR